jgi:hypothetical protein
MLMMLMCVCLDCSCKSRMVNGLHPINPSLAFQYLTVEDDDPMLNSSTTLCLVCSSIYLTVTYLF